MVILQGTCYPIVLVIYHFVTNYPPNLVAFNNIYYLLIFPSLYWERICFHADLHACWQNSFPRWLLAGGLSPLFATGGSLTWQLASLKHIS